MDSFVSLPESVRGGLLLWLILVGFAFFLALIIHIFTDRSAKSLLICGAENLFTFIFYQMLIDQLWSDSRLFIDIPAVTVALTDLFLTAAAAMELALCIRKRNSRLSMMSVKESMDGIDAARKIKEQRPEIKILLVTSMPEVSCIDRARAAGVESFWHKEVQEQPLLEIMDRTMAGESVYPMSTPAVQFGNIVSTELTDREIEVLRELVSAASNKEIGERLYMSPSTVKRHISEMLDKTGFKSRLQLAIRARGGGQVINNRDIETKE